MNKNNNNTLMTLMKKTKQQTDALFSAGGRAGKLKTAKGIGIKSGKRSIVLLDSAGNKKPAGIYYEQKSGTDLPAGGFLQ